jgi:hypothetical protein
LDRDEGRDDGSVYSKHFDLTARRGVQVTGRTARVSGQFDFLVGTPARNPRESLSSC